MRRLSGTPDNSGPCRSYAQWAQLEQVFATGVCDYGQPGVSQQGAIEWLTYADAQGRVVYGGTPLAPAPANSGMGWASPAFGVFQ